MCFDPEVTWRLRELEALERTRPQGRKKPGARQEKSVALDGARP